MTTSARTTRTAIALLALVASGCAQFTVRADQNPGTDFTRYRTFAWMPIAASPPEDQDTGSRALNDHIYSTVETELERRGYAPAPSATADLLVTFRILQQDGYEDAHIPYGAQWYRGAYLEAIHASPDTYERGTLVIDVIDRVANTLVWRGTASARLLPDTSFGATVERAEAAVSQTMKPFPAR